jgi:hypothetical protein
MNPMLPESERQRRKRWGEVPANIRKELKRLHVNMGHIPIVSMMRRLRRKDALPEAIAAVKDFPCDVCGDAVRRQRPRPTRPPGIYVFNYLLWIDTFNVKDIKRVTFAVFNLVCEGTRFGVQYAMDATKGVPAARTTFNTFCTVWCSWAGWPSVIRVDRGKEWMGEFAELCTQKGVEIDSKAPWQLGVA